MKLTYLLLPLTLTSLTASDIILLPTYTVTAQHREQNPVEVPISITAYDSAFIEQVGATSFDELGDFIPGLKIQEQSPNNPSFVIRGITSDSGEANLPPRISTFQDGISISRSQGNLVELYDLERIEVLKGPQGTLFGRSAQVGAIHLIQNKAIDETSQSLASGFGSFSEHTFKGHINTPLLTEGLFLRVAGIHRKSDGYIENLAGGTLNGSDVWAGRISLGFEPNPNTRFDLILNHQQDNAPGVAFKSGVFAPPGGDTQAHTPAALNRGRELGTDRSVSGATAIFKQALNDNWEFNSITGWRTYDSTEEFDADGTLAYFLELSENAEVDQFSQEFRFNYDSGERLSGFFGSSYFYEKASQNVIVRTDERSVFTIAPIPGVKPAFPLINADGTPNILTDINPVTLLPFNQNYAEQVTNAGKLNEKLELSAGLRGTYEQTESSFLIENNPNAFFTGQPGFVVAGSNGLIKDSADFFSIVGRVAALYRVTDALNMYASISRGRRPHIVAVDNDEANEVNEEVIWSYEVGFKHTFEKSNTYLEGSIFHYQYTDFQTEVIELRNGTITLDERDAGNASAWGAEITIHASPHKNLSLFANYAFIDARFADEDSQGNQQDFAGNHFRLTPKHSFSIGGLLEIPNRIGTAYFAPSFTWQSRVYFEDANQPGIEQIAYGLLNAKIGLRFGRQKNWDLHFYAKNILDKEYRIDGGNTGVVFGIPTYIAGPPRTMGVVLTASF
jgi:iron complex outermembrane receptor protein